ncbi:hypothetical protein Leryth_026788 [Lithospermum erythrorhizon]|nr:hypothetical protein Leryth_026788 [Lithospermum erythrorhizon]
MLITICLLLCYFYFQVCSSCSLRSSCERAYLLTNKEDEARTIDVMRILLTYGFDPINGPVLNKSLQKLKSVKTIVRKLLHEVVKLSAVPVDPNLSPPVFKKPPPKVKQPPPAPKKRVGRDDIEMKKGDWLCPKCDFMNFAKNTICLQCDAKRPKRQLLPGEWECPRCNFLNYRRNVVCFHCECNRPQDEYMESHIQEKQSGSRMRTGKVLNRQEVSNAWNFNFDDDESDGADVASFENADSSKRNEDFSMDKQALGRISEGYQDSYNNSGHTRMYERNNSSSVPMKSGTGFNDFSDEDDDVDNYEVDNRNESERASHVDFSDLEANSGSDSENGDSSRHAPRRTSLNDGNNPSRRGNHKSAFSRSKDAELDFGSDDDLPIHPNWKSSHVANPKQRNKHGGALSFGSDEDIGSDNEGMDGGFRSSRRVKDRQGDNRNRTFSDFGSDDERDFNTVKRSGASSTRNTSKGGALRGGRRQFSGTDDANYSRNAHDNGKSSFDRERSDGRRGNSQSFGGSNMRSQNQQQGRGALRGGRGQFTGTDDKYSRNARDNGKSSFDRQRSDGRRGNSQSLGGSNTRSHQERGRSTDRDSYYDDERFQKPRNNVR